MIEFTSSAGMEHMMLTLEANIFCLPTGVETAVELHVLSIFSDDDNNINRMLLIMNTEKLNYH